MSTGSKRVALTTGVTSQGGSHLAELLLKKGNEVHGITRSASLFNTQRIDHIYEDPHALHEHFVLQYGDPSGGSNLTRIVQQVQPDEVYNLGAQSLVAVSFESPEYTADVDAMGTLRLRTRVCRRGHRGLRRWRSSKCNRGRISGRMTS